MKKIVSSEMVAHLWAHQTQSEARNGHGSMYFEGNTIYSYGPHFPIARHYKGIVLVSIRSHSTTTSGHQSRVRQACSHLTSIDVLHLDTDSQRINDNFKYFTRKIDEFMQQSLKARLPYSVSWSLKRASDMCENANAYAKLMRRKRKFSLPDPEAIKLAVKKAKEYAKRATAKLIIKNAEKMAEWENGASIQLNYNLPCCLRLQLRYGKTNRLDTQVIQTSRGAEFPVSHGKRVYGFVKRCREAKTTFQRNGDRVRIGAFQIDSVSATGNVKAGCHNVTWDTIERLAKRMGW